MEEMWKSYEEMLCFMTNHKDIAEMAIEISKVKANIIANQVEDFKSGMAIIVQLSKSYRHVMGVSIQNIL